MEVVKTVDHWFSTVNGTEARLVGLCTYSRTMRDSCIHLAFMSNMYTF